MIKAVVFDLYGTLIDSERVLAPNAKELLQSLSPDYLLGLSTTSSRWSAESILKNFGLLEFIKASTCGDEVSQLKPDPEVFLKTIESLGALPGETVVLEDTVNGMRGAKAAGAVVIARKAGHNEHQDFSVADYVVEDLMDVIGIIKKLS
jgi:beta-phosphoglucomutase-like phosphatase (HAD superfamily)